MGERNCPSSGLMRYSGAWRPKASAGFIPKNEQSRCNRMIFDGLRSCATPHRLLRPTKVRSLNQQITSEQFQLWCWPHRIVLSTIWDKAVSPYSELMNDSLLYPDSSSSMPPVGLGRRTFVVREPSS